MIRCGPLIALLVCACPAAAAEARDNDRIPGPVMAHVVRVIDGDTILVDAVPWPAHSLRISVRLRCIDAAEMRSSCPAERRAARKARQRLEALALRGDHVLLTNISGGKYYGRVLADMAASPADLATAMLDGGLAIAYSGGRRERRDCGLWPEQP
ncbi:nuclease-like protein [Hoeflea marina]|uniref:Nuclease-like protein n=1 Tax=Hoeflea marina TaxID=274592 RepID=A0A317PL59_9HYPH|nr:thermonuclease family protein [Hoeflea marina]PWW00566.1 nuclease-like protein [Hoeflea marina]